jgi:hypothetical protein
VDAILAGLVAILGTLLGSGLTYMFQRKHIAAANELTKQTLLHEERLNAYSRFAEAATEYRRARINAWFRWREDPNNPTAYRTALADADRGEAVVRHALFRVQLVAGDPTVIAAAQEAFSPILEIRRKRIKDDHLDRQVEQCEIKLSKFIEQASEQILGRHTALPNPTHPAELGGA